MEDYTVPRFSKTRNESTAIISSLSTSLDELKKEADAQRKAFHALEERLQSQINKLKKYTEDTEQKFDLLKRYNEDAKQKLTEQLKFEVLDRFCGGLTGILQKNINDLKILLYILSVELENPMLTYAPVAFVFVTYYLYHERNALPDFFYQFPPRLHLKSLEFRKPACGPNKGTPGFCAATKRRIPPTSELTLGALSGIMDGPYSDIIQLLIHLWVIRAGLANKQSIAHPIPNITETLHDLIHDPDQQALIEQILPSLVEEEGINDQIKYFVSS
ncbi:uncharacterized protein ARMOST_17063 [Armillaria ostoyae]|uniref:Uncharacterized protein n=1 Tax=Armillaria ostoyae TaxID=47428 RepID=A0A284RXY7_ARMOS|nr:uncharacterized protein ARMOST_17063 [Armillaria ostoyae]